METTTVRVIPVGGKPRDAVDVDRNHPFPSEIVSDSEHPVFVDGVVDTTRRLGSTNAVVSVLTYAGDEVIPVPDGTVSITVTPSQTVKVTVANSALPAVPNLDGTINGVAYTCIAGDSTTIPLSTTAYNAMRITGPQGTRSVIGFNGADVDTRDFVLAGSYPTLAKTSLVSVLSGPYEAVNLSNTYRIRQNGTITKVKLFNGIVTGVDEVTVSIWRYNTATTLYDLVGRSENLISKLAANTSTAQTVTLTEGIQGVKTGDFIGVRCVCNNSAAGPLYIHTTTGAKIYYTLPNVWSKDVGMDWKAGGAITANTASAIPVQVYMESPDYVFIGDGGLANVTYNGSLIQGNTTLVTDDLPSTVVEMVARSCGLKTYQNMSTDASTLVGYATWAVSNGVLLDPNKAVVLLGLNDVIAGTSLVTVGASLASGLTSLLTVCTPIVVLPLPWTAGTNDQQVAMTAMRAMIIARCATAGVQYIDPVPSLGQNRAEYGITRVQRDLMNILFTHLARAANVATAICASPHGLQTGDEIIVKDCVDTTFNTAQVSVTRISATEFSYASTGTAQGSTSVGAGSLDHPIALITSVGHGLTTGMIVDIAGVTTADIDVTGVVMTKQSADTFTISNFGIAVADTADATGSFTSVDILPTTNLYDIATAYDVGDGINLNAAGNAVLAGLITAKIKALEA